MLHECTSYVHVGYSITLFASYIIYQLQKKLIILITECSNTKWRYASLSYARGPGKFRMCHSWSPTVHTNWEHECHCQLNDLTIHICTTVLKMPRVCQSVFVMTVGWIAPHLINEIVYLPCHAVQLTPRRYSYFRIFVFVYLYICMCSVYLSVCVCVCRYQFGEIKWIYIC